MDPANQRNSAERRDAKEAWEREYQFGGLPTSRRIVPSRAVFDIQKFLSNAKVPSQKILDLGCGLGRNAAYFAKAGHNVQGIDFVATLEHGFREFAAESLVNERLAFLTHDLHEPLPFATSSFDLAYALTTIENLLKDEAIIALGNELHRILRPNGFFAVYYITVQDGFYGPRVEARIDHRKLVWAEDTQMHQRVFERTEMEELFSRHFQCVSAKTYSFQDHRFGGWYQRHLELLILQSTDT